MTPEARSGWAIGCLLLAAAAPCAHADDGLVAAYGGCAGTVPERVIDADPSDYRALLPTLLPGDLLRLAAGTYLDGLPLDGLAGEPDRCITIEGPASGTARFVARPCCNTVSLVDVAYLVIRDLELDGSDLAGVDAVKAESTASFVHHVTLEDLRIHSHAGGDQQTVGISTKCPAWNLVIRRNRIVGAPGDPPAGTGIYLGNSDGADELVHSLIEHNLIVDPIGYAMQIKHQNGRPSPAMPVPGTTIIRHNVFVKANNASTGGAARPNLLVGHFPLSGPGAGDRYEIYGNFLFENASGSEALFQGTGNVAFYANLLYNGFGAGAALQFHEGGAPREVRVFHNTVVAAGTGVSVSGADPSFEQRVIGNAVFAAPALSGGTASDNAALAFADAGDHLAMPSGTVPGMALVPRPGALLGSAIADTWIAGFTDWDRDFDGAPRDPARRGAYAGTAAAWPLALERKPSACAIFADGFESGDTAAWTIAVGGRAYTR